MVLTKKVPVNNLDQYKPRVKSLTDVQALQIVPNQTVLMCKADGEFSVIYFVNHEAHIVNLWGTERSDFSAINQLAETLPLQSAILLGELYGISNGVMLKLPEVEHIIKSGSRNEIDEKIRLGIFDIVELNSKPVNDTYAWKLDELASWGLTQSIKEKAHSLPYIKPSTLTEAQNFWNITVESGPRFEGLFARSNGDLYKIKPQCEVDAVIIALNKRERWTHEEVTSFKVALIDDEGRFIELGDVASGIDLPLRKKLWELTKLKVSENDKEMFIQPLVIANIQFTQTFNQTMRIWRYVNGQYAQEGTANGHTMRHPRLLGFRTDKKVNSLDLRVSQLS